MTDPVPPLPPPTYPGGSDVSSDPAQEIKRGTVYVVVQSQWASGDVTGCLLLDTGEAPWGHMSSHIEWLKRDLTDGFKDRREQLEALYPNGYDVVVVKGDEDVPAEVMERNAAWAAAEDGGQADA